jgi:hypothetical protein
VLGQHMRLWPHTRSGRPAATPRTLTLWRCALVPPPPPTHTHTHARARAHTQLLHSPAHEIALILYGTTGKCGWLRNACTARCASRPPPCTRRTHTRPPAGARPPAGTRCRDRQRRQQGDAGARGGGRVRQHPHRAAARVHERRHAASARRPHVCVTSSGGQGEGGGWWTQHLVLEGSALAGDTAAAHSDSTHPTHPPNLPRAQTRARTTGGEGASDHINALLVGLDLLTKALAARPLLKGARARRRLMLFGSFDTPVRVLCACVCACTACVRLCVCVCI